MGKRYRIKKFQNTVMYRMIIMAEPPAYEFEPSLDFIRKAFDVFGNGNVLSLFWRRSWSIKLSGIQGLSIWILTARYLALVRYC